MFFIVMPAPVDFIFFELPVYSVMVILGIAAGLAVAHIFLRLRSPTIAARTEFIDAALIVLITGWIGARAYHVATHWDYYATRPDEIAQVGLGGLAIRGALIVGFIALGMYARRRGVRFARLADAAAIGLCVGQAIGWVGALAQGFNYGVVSDSAIALDLPDMYGLYAPRFPLQQIEIGLFLSLWVGLSVLATRRPQAGTLFATFLLIEALANFALGFQRGDEALRWLGWRIDQWIDLGFIGLALMFFIVLRREGNVGIN